MAVRKRNKRWYYDFMIRRVRYKASIPEAQTKQDALQAEAEARRAVYEGRYGKHAASSGFEKFVRETFIPYCKTNRKRWAEEERHALRFCEFFKGRTFAEISPMQIERYKKERRDGLTRYGTPRKASTVNQELSLLYRVFSLAIENGYTNQNPLAKVRRLKETDRRARYLTAEEEGRLRAALASDFPELLTLLEIYLNTGMRLREVLGLSASEVDLEEEFINLPPERTKEGRRKVIPLNRPALEALAPLVAEARGGRLFGRGYEASWVEKQWRRARERAGVGDIRIHDLRHTFATRLSERGTTERQIAGLLGHSTLRDLRMTAHYTHDTPEAKRRAVESLADCSNIVPPLRKVAKN
jgi:integrase